MQKGIFFLSAILCSSCASIYVPSVRNVPLFTAKGDFQGSVSMGNGTNMNAAYAFTDHLAISISGLYANNKPYYSEDDLFSNTWRVHQSMEGAFGFYANKNRMAFEIFAGFGVGSGKGGSSEYDPKDLIEWLFFSVDDETVAGSYQKIFFQPSFGFRRKRLELIWTLRFSHIDFKSISISRYENQILIPKTSFYFWEPSFTVKAAPLRKLPTLFIVGQAGLTVDAHQNSSPEFRYSFLNYSVGAGLLLNRAKKEK